MKQNKIKEIKKLVNSIIMVSTFLIVTTCFVYLPKQENLLSSLAFIQNKRSFYIEDISKGILLKNAVPVSDKKALNYEPYKFKVVNKSNKEIQYKIKFNNNEDKVKDTGKKVLDNKYLRYAINTEDNKNIQAYTLSDDGIILTTSIPKNSEVIFEFRMWLDYNADNNAMNKVFVGQIELEKIK